MKFAFFLISFLVGVFYSQGETKPPGPGPAPLTAPGGCKSLFSPGKNRNQNPTGQAPHHKGDAFFSTSGKSETSEKKGTDLTASHKGGAFSASGGFAPARLKFLYHYTGDTRAYRYITEDPHKADRFRKISLSQFQNNLQWLEQFINFTGGRKGRGRMLLSYYLHHGWINPHILFASKGELHKISTFLHQHIKKSPTPSQVREKVMGRLLIGEEPLTEETLLQLY